MARVAKDKAYRTFINGLVTEATGLSFPENSCRDISNCDIELKGSVRRRLGLTEEAGGERLGEGLFGALHPAIHETTYTASDGNDYPIPYARSIPGDSEPTADEFALTVHLWRHPGGDTSLNFVVFQIGYMLVIRNWDFESVSSEQGIAGIGPLDTTTGNLVPFTFVFGTYNTNSWTAARTPLQSSAGFGRLWLTGPAILPFFLAYEPETKTVRGGIVGQDFEAIEAGDFSSGSGRLNIRDFNGVSDGEGVAEQPTVLSKAHRYNLMNQGWTDEKMVSFYADASGGGPWLHWPANNMQWILGKNSTDDFSREHLLKQDFGSGYAPKGRGLMHALFSNRYQAMPLGQLTAATYLAGAGGGIPEFQAAIEQIRAAALVNDGDIAEEKATTSFQTVGFFAGRAWFAGDANPKRPNGVYFSRVLAREADAGWYCSDNDPTSEHFSDLLATDGGVIYITEADTIQKLVPFGAGMLVMASNGVWFIYGAENGFTATNYSVEKVSSTGILGPSSVAVTDQSVFFWAENSVHTLTLPESGVIPVVADIGSKIYTFYGLIPLLARVNAQACFDFVSKRIFWSYLEAEEYNYPSLQNFYNRMLILDTRTGAFSKHNFTTDSELLTGLGPSFPKRLLTSPKLLEVVVVEGQGAVTHTTGGDVLAFAEAPETDEFLTSINTMLPCLPEFSIRIGEFLSTEFLDFAHMPETTSYAAQDYSSFLITGDEVLDDLQRKKQATFLHNFFARTETGFEAAVDGSLVPKRPSGCTVVARWDWSNSGAGGRWTNAQRAYRYRRPYTPVDVDDAFDTGEEIVYTKLKVRGQGRSVTFRYDSESQKDFQLLGYSVAFSANGI